MRYVTVLIILLGISGCADLSGRATIYPHSEVDLPTFCLYRESLRSQNPERSQNSEPIPIRRLVVSQYVKANDERIEWKTWHEPRPSGWGEAWQEWLDRRPTRGLKKTVWFVQYLPDPLYQPLKPFSCITYGKAPPGYRERAPALPLTPETLYYVSLSSIEGHQGDMWFIIRTDTSGVPVKLESFVEDTIQVITQQ